MRRQYIPNLIVRTKEFEGRSYRLEVTSSGTVYLREGEGCPMRRLDSVWLESIGRLSVSLPDGRDVRFVPTPGGLIEV